MYIQGYRIAIYKQIQANHLVIVVDIFVWFLLAIQTNVILFDSVLGGRKRHYFYIPGPDTSDV